VPLVRVDTPHPEPQEASGLFAQRWPDPFGVRLHEVEEVVGHLPGAYRDLAGVWLSNRQREWT
jgi:hypothetical protein